ncbi:MAG: hypothetical protein K9L59_11975 [Desulfobacterales bacterium]|nr:hypothetical protein [Desulfobacterales bacterium]
MEDLPGNLQSDLKAKRVPRPSRRSSRWTLLFVGDHGQTVSVRRFKSLFYLLMGLLLLAVGAAAGLYLYNRQTFDENQWLRAETHRLRETVEALRYEKDVLTARLVLTEAGFQKESPEAKPPPAQEAEGPSDASGKEKGSPEKASAHGPEAAPEAQPEPVPVQELPAEQAPAPGEQTETGQEHAGAVESTPVSVAVENMSVVHEQDRPLLRVTFVIRKGDPGPESVSGHAFVVLKQKNDSSGDSWVLIPWAKVEEGRPSPASRGQFFSISRFKPMKFETTGVSDTGRFDLLTVYIFNTGGELILEKDFSMTAEEVEAG